MNNVVECVRVTTLIGWPIFTHFCSDSRRHGLRSNSELELVLKYQPWKFKMSTDKFVSLQLQFRKPHRVFLARFFGHWRDITANRYRNYFQKR